MKVGLISPLIKSKSAHVVEHTTAIGVKVNLTGLPIYTYIYTLVRVDRMKPPNRKFNQCKSKPDQSTQKKRNAPVVGYTMTTGAGVDLTSPP